MYVINSRTTYCEMKTFNGGWELVGHAAGTGNWPAYNLNMNPSSNSGTYSASWDVTTTASYFRSYSHALQNGVNDDVEIMFMTGDRHYWLVVKQADVTKKQVLDNKLNAQVPKIFDGNVCGHF